MNNEKMTGKEPYACLLRNNVGVFHKVIFILSITHQWFF